MYLCVRPRSRNQALKICLWKNRDRSSIYFLHRDGISCATFQHCSAVSGWENLLRKNLHYSHIFAIHKHYMKLLMNSFRLKAAATTNCNYYVRNWFWLINIWAVSYNPSWGFAFHVLTLLAFLKSLPSKSFTVLGPESVFSYLIPFNQIFHKHFPVKHNFNSFFSLLLRWAIFNHLLHGWNFKHRVSHKEPEVKKTNSREETDNHIKSKDIVY